MLMAMACALPKPVTKSRPHLVKQNSQNIVKIFYTSYSDDFHSEREILRKQILLELRGWCESKQLRLVDCDVKWGGRDQEGRDVLELERIQTSIENCYYSQIKPFFINFTSDSLGWVPAWGEYADEVVEDYIDTYGVLSEDMEVMKTAYRSDNPNSLFLVRNDSFLDSVPDEEQCAFVKQTKASEKLWESGDKILMTFPVYRICHYNCTYKDVDPRRQRARIEFDEHFRKKIVDFFKERISLEFCGEEPELSNNPYTQTRQAHMAFMKKKSVCTIGRDDVLEKLESYIGQSEKDVPLVLLGGAGSGKSSILCKATNLITDKASKREILSTNGQAWYVFYHFVGAVPGSLTLEPMLKRLLIEMDVTKDSNSPKNLECAAQLCCSMLSNPNTKPLILIVDALNQFTEDQAVRILSWLPQKLAPQVRCILSVICDTGQHKALLQRETKPSELTLAPLDLKTRKEIVIELLNKYKKSLTPEQLNHLLKKQSSENPLWLSVATQEIQLVDSDLQISQRIAELPDGLLNLLVQVMMRLESEANGHLITATLCLLEASASGLLEEELRALLGQEENLMPPSPFDEKEEKESSEKETKNKQNRLSDAKWSDVFRILRPFLRPYGESSEGRLDFYHRALSKAVRKKYFDAPEGEAEINSIDAYQWWHKKLSDYFEHATSIERHIEEYPYHVVCLEDTYRLAQCLCNWSVFDRLYHEEYSSQLLAYWRKVGSASEMVVQFKDALTKLEGDSVNAEEISIRFEKVCRVVIQSGKYMEALELLKTAMKIEERELGARPHRMVELYALMAEIYDEKLKLNDFVSQSQLPDLRKTISYGRRSITLRKQFSGTYHKFKLAMSLMKLAFSLESWEACGGGPDMSPSDAIIEGNAHIDKALKIFAELKDQGHYAEALMTKGVLAPRGNMEQLKYYNEAMELCMQIYGVYHILTSRLYINIGIVYEDNSNYNKAYEYFKKWAQVSEEILGPQHPKTLRAKGVLKERRYRRIAQILGEWDYEECSDENNIADNNDQDDEDDECENSDVMDFYDDLIQGLSITGDAAVGTVTNAILPNTFLHSGSRSGRNRAHMMSGCGNDHVIPSSVSVGDNATDNENVINTDNICTEQPDDGDGDEDADNNDSDSSFLDDDGEKFPLGTFDEDRDNIDEGNHDNAELDDNDFCYDDDCTDYDEQYILHLDTEPVIEEFNIYENYGDEDRDMFTLSSEQNLNQSDNRYANDRL